MKLQITAREIRAMLVEFLKINEVKSINELLEKLDSNATVSMFLNVVKPSEVSK